MSTIALASVPTETPIKVVRRVGAEAIPATGAHCAAFLLRLVDFILQLRGARVNELELRELSVEDADDLCELWIVSAGVLEA